MFEHTFESIRVGNSTADLLAQKDVTTVQPWPYRGEPSRRRYDCHADSRRSSQRSKYETSLIGPGHIDLLLFRMSKKCQKCKAMLSLSELFQESVITFGNTVPGNHLVIRGSSSDA